MRDSGAYACSSCSNSGKHLKNKLRGIDGKLAKITDVLETVGVNDIPAKRLTRLEQERTDTEKALE